MVRGRKVGGGNKCKAEFVSKVDEQLHEEHLPQFKRYGITDMEGYKQRAKSFGEQINDGVIIRGFLKEDGSEIKFNTVTNEFGVFTPQGKIVTYYIVGAPNSAVFPKGWEERAAKNIKSKIENAIEPLDKTRSGSNKNYVSRKNILQKPTKNS